MTPPLASHSLCQVGPGLKTLFQDQLATGLYPASDRRRILFGLEISFQPSFASRFLRHTKFVLKPGSRNLTLPEERAHGEPRVLRRDRISVLWLRFSEKPRTEAAALSVVLTQMFSG